MPTLTRWSAVLLGLLAFSASVAVPSALAQGAGDEQYQDPFEGDDSGTTTKAAPAKPSKPSVPSSGTSPTPVPVTPTAAPRQAPAQELARTGTDLRAPLAIGVLLLAGGALAFRWSRPAGT